MAKKPPELHPAIRSGSHREFGVWDDHALWCREIVDFDNRQDSMPCCNGVSVGQHWRNLHTGNVERVDSIWLAGVGVYTAHSESVEFVAEEGHYRMMGWPLWSLVEHWELVEPAEVVPEEPEYALVPSLDGGDPIEITLPLDLEEDEWKRWRRVKPQPFVWKSRDAPNYRESTLCLRVKHHRPRGEVVECWKEGRARFEKFENDVVLRNGRYAYTDYAWRHRDERQEEKAA